MREAHSSPPPPGFVHHESKRILVPLTLIQIIYTYITYKITYFLERVMSLLSSSRVKIICRTGVFVHASRHSKNIPGTSHERRTDCIMIVEKCADGIVSGGS